MANSEPSPPGKPPIRPRGRTDVRPLKRRALTLRLRAERWFLYYSMRLFRVRGAPEGVARGFALGLVVNFFPTFGLGVLISGVVARLLGGHFLAGVLGGATLTFAWPLLFFLNLRTGGWLLGRMVIRDPEEVTEEKINALVWGQAFTLGAVVNSLVIGSVVYLALYWVFRRYRQHGLAWLYKKVKEHQRQLN